MGRPDFIIIGETKCGTTSMYNYLVQHPNILDTYGNSEKYDKTYATKEIRFLDKFYERGWDWYFSRFPETTPGQITGEATPMYMYRTLAANRLSKHLPEVKLIVMLRNPVNRLISNYEHNCKWVPGWMELYPSLRTYFYGCLDRDYYQIEKSIYYFSIKRWLEYFPIEQFCIVKSEEMYQNPEEIYCRITRFLGLDDNSLDNYPIYRSNEYNDIDPYLRKELEEFYRPFNIKLEQLINYKMNWF